MLNRAFYRSFGRALAASALPLALGASLSAAQGIPATGVRTEGLLAKVITLPGGAQPEGIAKGPGTRAFVGMLAGGGVLDVDLLSGKIDVLVEPRPDGQATGLVFDASRNLVIVSGATTGTASFIDVADGRELDRVQLTSEPSVINDVALSSDAAFFTDSMRGVIYRVEFRGRRAGPVREIQLSGDFQARPGQTAPNGIEVVLDGRFLLIVNTSTGELFRVDASSGAARRIDLAGGNVMNGDGILLEGNRLLVVQNALNQVAVVELDETLTSGRVVDTLTDPEFRFPTTIASFDGFLFVVNGRFNEVQPGMAQPTDQFQVVRVSRGQ